MRDRRTLIAPFVMMAVLFFALSLSSITVKAENQDYGLKNPEINSFGITSWDCVYFGHYPQGSDGNGGFIDEPIKWRVLKVDGDDAFLLADKSIDKMPLCAAENDPKYSCLWHVSTVRSWLNGYGADENQRQIDYSSDNFISKAFTAEELEAVKTTQVITDKSTDWHFDWIESHHYYMETNDKVYLLDFYEMLKPEYGFTADEEETIKRVSLITAYTAAGGSSGEKYKYGKEGDKGSWILRSPGEYSMYVDMLTTGGGYIEDKSDICPVTASEGIRPVLHLDLTRTDVYSYAGKAVAREQQEISVTAQFYKRWGDAPFNLKAVTSGDSVLTYVSDNEAAATVDEKGNVTPQGLGTAIITVTAPETDNYSEASKTVKVVVNKRSPEIETDANVEKLLGDKAFRLNISVITDGVLTYESDNPSVAAVAEDGTVTILGVGTANITITASATDNCNEAVKTVQVTVKKAAPVVPVVKKQAPKITVKKTSATIKFKKLKKKAQSFSIGASVNSKGKLTYKKLSGKKQVSINKSGKVTIKKKAKKGTYKIKVKVSAAAAGNYTAGARTVTITVKVK